MNQKWAGEAEVINMKKKKNYRFYHSLHEKSKENIEDEGNFRILSPSERRLEKGSFPHKIGSGCLTLR